MEPLIGKSSVCVISSIAASLNEADEVEFVYVPWTARLVQDRINITLPIHNALRKALVLRHETHLPFWDSVLVSTFGASHVSPLFAAALHHNPTPTRRVMLTASSCTASRVSDLVSQCYDNEVLAIVSTVRQRSGTIAHLPLIDFHLPCSTANAELAQAALAALGAGPGYLLCSGKSYHFVGSRLIDQAMLVPFLARCLLLSPVIDRSWIAHQLLEGRCALRVSARAECGEPKVISAV